MNPVGHDENVPVSFHEVGETAAVSSRREGKADAKNRSHHK